MITNQSRQTNATDPRKIEAKVRLRLAYAGHQARPVLAQAAKVLSDPYVALNIDNQRPFAPAGQFL